MYPAINPEGPGRGLLTSFKHSQVECADHAHGRERPHEAASAAERSLEPQLLPGAAGRQSDSDINQEAADPEAWAKCAQVIEEHHRALVKRWRDEIDTLLVYAGLFSAVLTAFNVELYALLQPDTTATNNAMLAQLVAQPNGGCPDPNLTICRQTFAASPLPSTFHAAASSVWVNTLWFSSLICSLSAASLGMMVKQWLHESELGLSGTSRDTARLRQLRLDSLEKWRVGAIVALLPVLLQIASALFLAGLLIFLWTLHRVVASVASAIVALNVIFVLVTLFAPAFSEDCAYRSLQSLVPFLAIQAIQRYIRRFFQLFSKRKAHRESSSSVVWGSYRGWAGLERAVVRSRGHRLDVHTVEAAHILKLDDAFTHDVLRRCAHTLPQPYASRCIGNLIQNQFRHLGTELPTAGKLAPYFDVALTLAFDAVRSYLDHPETAGMTPREGLNDVAKSLQALLHCNNLLTTASSKLGGRHLRDLSALLTYSIEARHKEAESAAFGVLTQLILDSPWSRPVNDSTLAGLDWGNVFGQDGIAAKEVMRALCSVLRRGTCRQNHRLRFKAYFSLIKTFGIHYIQYPPHEAQLDDLYRDLREIFATCARDLRTLPRQHVHASLLYVADASNLLARLSQEHPQSLQITGNLEPALDEAMSSRRIPWFVTWIVTFHEAVLLSEELALLHPIVHALLPLLRVIEHMLAATMDRAVNPGASIYQTDRRMSSDTEWHAVQRTEIEGIC